MRRYKGESDTKSFEAKVQGLSEDDIPTFDILVLLTWTCSSSCEAHAAISVIIVQLPPFSAENPNLRLLRVGSTTMVHLSYLKFNDEATCWNWTFLEMRIKL